MANAIVLEVLDFVRPIRLQVERISLADVVRDAIVDGRKPRAARRRRRCDVALPEDLPPIQGDPHQLRQLFTNLLTNAFEAIERHRARCAIAAHAAAGRRGAARRAASTRGADDPGRGHRQRPGHAGGRDGPDLQPVLHDEAAGLRAGARDRAEDRGRARRADRRAARRAEGGTRFRVTLPVSGSHELFR